MASLEFELVIIKSTGLTAIAGLDEAGRGALAGPVVAAAVILPLSSSSSSSSPDLLKQLSEVNDSKQLSANTRAKLYPIIQNTALTFGIGIRSAQYVDRYGIISSTKQAMLDALQALIPPAEYLLIDGRIRLPRSSLPQQSIIRGDSKSLSIAAASILAKVTRDQVMIALDAQYPEYGFARHKGYGTVSHRHALRLSGPTPEHRLTFSPLKATLL